MKYVFLIGFALISFRGFAEKVDVCDKPNQPDYYYETCPTKKMISNETNFEGKENLVIADESFEVKYYASVFTETKKKGALTLSSKRSVKVNKFDVNLRYEECVHKRCDLNEYRVYLQGLAEDIGVFYYSMTSSSNREKLEDNVKKRLSESDSTIAISDIVSARDFNWNIGSNPLFFKFSDDHGTVIAYIRGDVDLNGNVKLSEYIYRVVEDGEASWIGNRDYDLNASDTLWSFLWERNLRRVKKCVKTVATVRNPNGESQNVPSTQCWYAYQGRDSI